QRQRRDGQGFRQPDRVQPAICALIYRPKFIGQNAGQDVLKKPPGNFRKKAANSLSELTFYDAFSLVSSDLALRRTSHSVIAPSRGRIKENPSDKENVSLRRNFVRSSLRPCDGTGRCLEC